MNMLFVLEKIKNTLVLFFVFFVAAGASAQETIAGFENDTIQWINHLDFRPGHPVVQTSFNAVNPGTLVVRSTTLGDIVPGGGNKVIEMSLQVPPRHLLKGVRICYRTTNRRTYITQTRLAQLQNPPASWLVRLDDPTNHNSLAPVCENSLEVPTAINPVAGSIRFPLRFYFGSVSDSVVIYAVGLWLQPY